MDYYVLDTESFYDSKAKYSLRSLTTEEYINDPRFHLFGFSIKKNGGKSLWVPEEKVEFMLRQLKLHEHAVIMHNAQFDAAILSWKYGVKPKFIVDTLSMARGILGNEERLSLEALGERYGIGKKGDTVLHMDGVRHPSPQMTRKLGEYACNDADMTWELWLKLKEGFPLKELMVIDITTRMFSEPSFVLDKKPILRELELGATRKEELLRKANCTMGDLRSDAKFATLLESLGVEPPKKLSVKKSEKAGEPVYTWAFAKSDVDFRALGGSDDDLVRWAVEARLGLKSTIKQSRAERFLTIAERFGTMPVALTYFGAATGRYSAAASAKVNMQNLPAVRGSDDPDVGLLRKALAAPAGKVIVVSDAAQIEARIVAWLAGQDDLVEAFAQGRDVYSEMASKIFGRTVDPKKNPEDKLARFLGKCTTLGSGYSMGYFKFGQTVYAGMLGGPSTLFNIQMAEQLDIDVGYFVRSMKQNKELFARFKESLPTKQTAAEWAIHLACAKKIVDTYRMSNPKIPELWKRCDRLLTAMHTGEEITLGPFTTGKNILQLANGTKIIYKDIEWDKDGGYSCLRRKEGRVQRVKLYGGKILENGAQALAGAYVKEAMVRMHLKGHRPILQVHDEVVCLADEDKAEQVLREVNECMETVPSWAVGLPLAAEGDFARSYGDAK